MVYSLGSASTGSVSSENRLVPSSVTSTQNNVGTLVAPQVRKWSFFVTKLYREHIESYLRGLGYSELVQGPFEKGHFSRETFLVKHQVARFFI